MPLSTIKGLRGGLRKIHEHLNRSRTFEKVVSSGAVNYELHHFSKSFMGQKWDPSVVKEL
jgi:hypothetical protein